MSATGEFAGTPNGGTGDLSVLSLDAVAL
jgi:hypothetical protein